MKLGTYRFPEGMRPIAAIGAGLAIDLRAAWPTIHDGPAPASVRDLLVSGDEALGRVRALADEIRAAPGSDAWLFKVQPERLAPAVPDPPKVLCVGLNYREHVTESERNRPAWPEIFTRVPRSLAGPFDVIALPRESSQLDWEGELAVVIGRAGRRIAATEAARHIAGFAVFNDMTLRDWQHRSLQWAPAKNFDGTGPLGPYVITRDEVDPSDTEIITRVNGEVVQDARTSEMLFKVEELIAFCSTFTTLEPGDVIATGTPGGVGFRRQPPRFLRAGDEVEVEIGGVGSIRNRVELA